MTVPVGMYPRSCLDPTRGHIRPPSFPSGVAVAGCGQWLTRCCEVHEPCICSVGSVQTSLSLTMVVELPPRFYRFLWITEAALALIHVYATYDNPNEVCFGRPDNSPAHSESRIACTLVAGFASTLMRSLMLSIGACEICVDARCRNCCSALAYHGQLILWPIVMFYPLSKSTRQAWKLSSFHTISHSDGIYDFGTILAHTSVSRL